ncbi:small ribosomal subunit protein bS18m [Taeniopygia guttata]|uniref:small ribosomal subunit protein bS18m n=1 Tax=Taeniopygia guttata TaxID=59729 RepID=UPI003BB96F50
MAARAVAARRSWPRLALAKLWARPRRLQHEGQPEGQPERSDQPIQMENPYKDPPKRCVLCGVNVDYKNVQLLSQFVSPYTGSIYGRHITGLCNKKQKEITKAIKRAHVFGFMPVMFKNPQFLTDPKLCNIKYPE